MGQHDEGHGDRAQALDVRPERDSLGRCLQE
jgi:hypothetical protein